MKDVDASEAEQLLDQLLDEVLWGETFLIMRDGKPIAQLTPEADARRASEAIKALARCGEQLGKAPVDEVLATINEGHKY
jgi:antitoxin (DNA-binding transcriptional repressor) of toxin-antitoxin stability system